MIQLLNFIVDVLRSLNFLIIVHPDERGVKTRLGRHKDEFGQGWYFKWPIIESVEVLSVVERVVDTPTQSLLTVNSKSVVCSGTLSYKIVDASLAHFNVYEYEDSIIERCKSVITRTITRTMDTDLATKRLKIERDIVKTLKTDTEDWGIEIIDFTFENLAFCRTLRLLQE